MPTFIELHILVYFCLFFLVCKSVQILLNTYNKNWTVIVSAIVFSVIKFLMDFFNANIFAQIAVIILYAVTATLGINRFNHISKLISSCCIMGFFYACLMGIHAIIMLLAGKSINYISNLYLLVVLGTSLIVFGLINVFKQYYKLKESLRLTKVCNLKVGELKFQFSGFIDTGNTLKDPISGKSVVIISLNLLKKHISTQMYADILFATNASGSFDDIHKIKYSTINGTNFITIFKPDLFSADGKVADCYIGVSSKEIECGALLNVACL